MPIRCEPAANCAFGITERIDDVRLNGHPTDRLPHNLHVSVRGVVGEDDPLFDQVDLQVEGVEIDRAGGMEAYADWEDTQRLRSAIARYKRAAARTTSRATGCPWVGRRCRTGAGGTARSCP
mgnify:CR=1 FL=1